MAQYIDGDYVVTTLPSGSVTRELKYVATPTDPCQYLIDTGPFFDRFTTAKMAVLTSTDAAVKAILQDVQVRKWIDLKRADVASSLAYIGTVVPALTGTLQTAILTTSVTAEENRILRKSYF